MVNPFISMGDLSSEEQSAVRQLKQRMDGDMDPKLFDDLNVFVRFLRARDLNLNAAEGMLRKHLEWRKFMDIDNILVDYTPKEVIQKYLTVDVLGVDREGSPIIFLNIGQVDSRGLLKCAKRAEIVKRIVHKIEICVQLMQKQSLKEGKLIDKLTIIINFDKLPFSTVTHKETLLTAANLVVMYEANYPERLKAAYCLNVSVYFTMGFRVVKHFISEKTYRKINFLDKDDSWKEELLKVIHPEVLPAFLGGARTDPDGNPFCKTIVTLGGLVPESYFAQKKGNTLAGLPGVKRLIVTRMSKAHIPLDVTEPGSLIEWEFQTTVRDIGFSVSYKEDKLDFKPKELIPKQRIDTAVLSETGMFKCKKPGIYIIEFDNSYSWIFQKEVYYKVSVVQDTISG